MSLMGQMMKQRKTEITEKLRLEINKVRVQSIDHDLASCRRVRKYMRVSRFNVNT